MFRRWQNTLTKHYVRKILKSILGKAVSTSYPAQVKWPDVREIKGVRTHLPEVCHLSVCQVSCLKFTSQVVYFVTNSWLMSLKWCSYDLTLQFCGVLSEGTRQYWRHKRRDKNATPVSFNYIYILAWLHSPIGRKPFLCSDFEITFRHITLDRAPLQEWSARHKCLYLTTHNTHDRQKPMSAARFEHVIPGSERPRGYRDRFVLYIWTVIYLSSALHRKFSHWFLNIWSISAVCRVIFVVQ